MIDLKSLLNLSRIDGNFAVAEAINENKELVLQPNDVQLDKGLDSKGKDLGEYKNFKYKNRFRPVDLLLTGEFRNEEDVITDNTEMVYIDPNEKTESLMNRYGQDIIGLPDTEFESTGHNLTPFVINQLERQIS